ncbi:1,4-dihydroxy-2-naphthoate octaprenyltransferase [Pontimicrobium sp. IMCC45349]|uniref:1,4-dihydroxy-2-naphthoate octaprenyltransferase n=1 Tax=Pontimicrobium sp. IMCC45349 TaxID=3391574 RepID=UPI0039A2F926
MDKFKLWLSAFRLRTLPLSVSGIIVSSCFAFYDGIFKWSIFILALLATISLQILSNIANDYGDGVKGTDNNNRIGPERAIQSGKITPSEMYTAIKLNVLVVIMFVFFLIYAAFGSHNFVYSILFITLGAISISAAIKYTVGKSAYGYRALGDIMVFLFFGLLSVFGTYFLYAKDLSTVLILPASIIGILSAGVLHLNNMRDIVSDKASNKTTVAILLGFKNAKRYHVLMIAIAIVLTISFCLLFYRSWANLLPLVMLIPLIKHIIFVANTEEPVKLDSQLKIVALATFFLSILMGLGFVINGL